MKKKILIILLGLLSFNLFSEEYIVTYKFKQQHFTLDLFEHVKDESNAFEISLPTTKEFYDSLTIGQTITDNLRYGSIILRGSFGKNVVTVVDKKIVY